MKKRILALARVSRLKNYFVHALSARVYKITRSCAGICRMKRFMPAASGRVIEGGGGSFVHFYLLLHKNDNFM